MTLKEVSTLNYAIGKIEGAAAGCEEGIQTALLDLAELLNGLLLDEVDTK